MLIPSEELKEELEWHPRKRSILEHKIKYQEKAESDQCSDDAVIINCELIQIILNNLKKRHN